MCLAEALCLNALAEALCLNALAEALCLGAGVLDGGFVVQARQLTELGPTPGSPDSLWSWISATGDQFRSEKNTLHLDQNDIFLIL